AGRVWLRAVLSVALKVPTPLVRVASAGRIEAPSLLVKCTVPVYPVAVLLNTSRAVTVKLNAAPAVAVAGALTVKCVAAPPETAIPVEVPAIDGVAVSVAVSVWLPPVLNVADNVLTPFVRVEAVGRLAAPSLELKCTVPA